MDDPKLEALLDYLKRSRGFDFTVYKRTSLSRRIQKRMQLVGLDDYELYLDYLQVHPDEFPILFNTILINVTSFFRDSGSWEYLASDIIPRIIAEKGPDDPIRVWSAGCASGEEAYSVAILFADALGTEAFRERVKVYATDADDEALAFARQASYGQKQVASVPPEMLEKYFEQAGHRHVFHRDLRKSVIFGRHDLIQDAPISRIDLLICRNTLMYFNSEAQARILDRFHFALNEHGYLMLGKAEMLFTHSTLFTPVDLKRRIFAKQNKVNPRDRLLLVAHATAGTPAEPRLVEAQSDRIRESALEFDPVARIIIGSNGTLVMANHRARSLFEISDADVGRQLHELEISYRPIELRSCLRQVESDRRAITVREVEWRPGLADVESTNDDVRYLDVQLIPLVDDEQILLGVMVIFTDVSRFKVLKEELQQSKQELETAYEELQSSNEELVTTNEELQSTVEELETTNEELQSTNEELETMNEELQSTNEELQTINDELRNRGDELNRLNAFLEAILGSLRRGVIVVDSEMHIRIWNHKSEDLWGLRSDEVVGRHLLNLDIGLPVDRLKQTIRTCLTGESELSELNLEAINRRGRTIQCTVSATPLIGVDGAMLGAIVLVEELE